MRAHQTALATAAVAAILAGFSATTSSAQEFSNDRAPVIRVYSQNGPGVASNYVTPAIDLGEDAYVFAVSIDLDGQIQVLHPAAPGISLLLRSHHEVSLPNFFGGYSRSGGGIAYSGNYTNYGNYTDLDDSRGTVIALASRQPFNLERIESDGDWNLLAVRNLVERRDPLAAEQALASYLGAKGEPIGRDYMRFASFRNNYYADYAGEALYSCNLFYGSFNPGLAFNRLAVLDRVARLRRSGQNARIIGYDFCGMPIVFYGPSRFINGNGHLPPPRQPADTGRTKRFGHLNPRSTPNTPSSNPTAALGFFPRTKQITPPQTGDVTVAAPRRLSRSPGEVLIDTRKQPAMGVISPSKRVPVEGVAPPRAQTGATGAVPARVFTPPAPRENPPPPRAEPTRSSPPPRVETPRSSPPPRASSPPPRVETRRTQQAPASHR